MKVIRYFFVYLFQRVWFVFLSIPYLKDDLDQKIHSWSFSTKNSCRVVKPQPKAEETCKFAVFHMLLYVLFKVKSNDIYLNLILVPEQLLRHVERYETPRPVVKTETVSAVAIERNDMNFATKDEIVNVIERNQALIFNKAQYVMYYIFLLFLLLYYAIMSTKNIQ